MNNTNNTLSPLIQESTTPEEDFNPGFNDACYCGSEKLFGQCCGSTEIIRPPPFGLFMFENYLDSNVVADLMSYARQCDGEPLLVIDNKASTPDNIVRVKDKRRVTERVNLGERRKEMIEIVRSTFLDLSEKCVGRALEWFEAPDLMRYHKDGYYERHADSQNYDLDTRLWSKIIDRDLSLLIYLNDDFEGGELSFYKLRYQIRPRAGAAVMFPADQRFLHQAEIVTKGERYAIVSWAALRGIPKVSATPPEAAILLD